VAVWLVGVGWIAAIVSIYICIPYVYVCLSFVRAKKKKNDKRKHARSLITVLGKMYSFGGQTTDAKRDASSTHTHISSSSAYALPQPPSPFPLHAQTACAASVANLALPLARPMN